MLRTPRGDILNVRPGAGEFIHPWMLDVRWEEDEFAPDGEWRAYVNPGFVNGRDAYINTPVVTENGGIERIPVALTADETPWISLDSWRNPLASAGIAVTANGDLRTLPGEGYPKFFQELAVSKPAGSEDTSGADETSTRQIRAIDIVLNKPRITTRIDPVPVGGGGGLPFALIGVSFTTPSDFRPMLRATSKFSPPAENNTLAGVFGLLLNAGDPPVDQILMSRVWILSPPDAAEDSEPDASWEPYAQHFVFWNLKWASNLVIEATVDDPITLRIPLGAGILNPIADFMLSGINQMTGEVRSFLNKAKSNGIFWT
jgi:hypothetical protein